MCRVSIKLQLIALSRRLGIACLLTFAWTASGQEGHHLTTSVSSNKDIKVYDVAELRKENPKPAKSVEQKLGDKFTEFFVDLGANSKGFKKLFKSQQIPDKKSYFEKNAFFYESEPSYVSRGDVGDKFNSDTKSTLSRIYVERNPLIQNLQSGFDFSFDPANMFRSPAPKPTKIKDPIRYGLIIKEINPRRDINRMQAAVHTDESDISAMAVPANVVWTIGPIEEFEHEKIYPSSDQEFKAALLKKDSKKYRLPSTKIKGSAKLKKINDLTQKENQLSGFSIKLAQEEDLYGITVDSSQDFKKQNLEHHILIPVYEELKVGRVYTDTLQVKKSTIKNVLIKKSLPKVTMHYNHLGEQYQVSAEKSFGSMKLMFKTSSKGNDKLSETDRAEKYTIEVKTTF